MPCYRIKSRPETLWDAKERAGLPHGYLSKRPLPGQGHPEHPDLWPEEVRREKEEVLQADADVWMCGALGPHCNEAGCTAPGDNLCDWPMGRGKTCDLPLCDEHAREVGIDRHFCAVHHRIWQAQTAPPGGNTWPPKP